MLRLEDVAVSFGKTDVLKNINCTLEAGDFVVIVGGNGAGKSTLFDTIAGKIKPQAGKISINNQEVTNLDEIDRSSLVTRIFQKVDLNSIGSFSVAKNLAFARYSRKAARLVDGMNTITQEEVATIIGNLGLDAAVIDRPMKSLSGGQKQLIAFAMATQQIPHILLLDEPTAALDPQAATTLLKHAVKFIKEHKVTTILITHDPHIALHVGNKIWILEQGKIVKQFNQSEKNGLKPEDLIGQIDYKSLL